LSWGKLNTSSNSLDLTLEDEPVYDFEIINNKDLIYTKRTTAGLTNYALDLTTKVKTELFTVPFFEANIDWGSTTVGSHYVYPKATFALEGYLYEFSKKTMSRTSVSGFGLTAFNTPNYLVYNKLTNYVPSSYIYNKGSGKHYFVPLIVLPEKCVPSQKNIDTIWCGYEPTELEVKFPDNWYRGLLSFKDTIWEVDLNSQTAVSLVDTLAESGREIDIINMSIGESESALYFINKNDNTLWMYEL
jgi:hypothetical protein